MPRADLLVLVPAAVGVALGAYAAFAPTTGVTGSPGAWLALAGAAAVLLGMLLASRLRGGARTILLVLVGLGSALTAVAAWFLMQEAFTVAMALAALGLLAVAVLRPDRRAAPTSPPTTPPTTPRRTA